MVWIMHLASNTNLPYTLHVILPLYLYQSGLTNVGKIFSYKSLLKEHHKFTRIIPMEFWNFSNEKYLAFNMPLEVKNSLRGFK